MRSTTSRQAAASARRHRVIGVIVVAAVALGIVVAYLKPNPFRGGQTVHVMFRDAAGIGVVGADVRVDGARVGRITARRRIGDQGLLTLQLDENVGTIHRDARAELRPRTPFEGTAYVDLDPGAPPSPPLGQATLGIGRTRSYVALDQALRFATPDTRTAIRTDVAQLQAMFRAGGRAGLHRLLRIAPALTREAEVAGRAARGPGGEDLRLAVDATARTLHALASSSADLAGVSREAGPTFAALHVDAGRPLDAAIAALPGRLSDLRSGGDALRGAVAELDAVSPALRRGVADLPATIRQTRPVLRSARPVLAAAPRLLDELRSTVRAASVASAPTRRLLDALEPVDALLTGSLLPALEKKTALGAPAYLEFINLFQGGGGAFRPFQTTAQGNAPLQSGAGHFVRFSARFFTGMGYPLPPCTALEKVNPTLASVFAQNGVCQ